MCLLLVAHNCCEGYKLIIAANRDEYHERPTSPAAIWSDNDRIIGGRDERSSGTWLAVDRTGRFATITNVPLGNKKNKNPRSRGLIVNDFLKGKRSARHYVESLSNAGNSYDGFNTLVHDSTELVWYSNNTTDSKPEVLPKGIYTLSNATLKTRWPKTERLRNSFQIVFDNYPNAITEPLFDVLRDKGHASTREDSEQEVLISDEKPYSSIFINGDVYGTRCSTVITIDEDNRMAFNERRYDAKGKVCGQSKLNFKIEH